MILFLDKSKNNYNNQQLSGFSFLESLKNIFSKPESQDKQARICSSGGLLFKV